MTSLFFKIWPFTTIKTCHFDQKFAKESSTFSQILNNPKNIGKISPNLVTLRPQSPIVEGEEGLYHPKLESVEFKELQNNVDS